MTPRNDAAGCERISLFYTRRSVAQVGRGEGVVAIFEAGHEGIMYGFLADLVVGLHAAFVVFVAVGGLLVWKAPRLAWLHLPAVTWGVGIEWTGAICPLTPIEVWLRQGAGEVGYQGDFVGQYVMPWLYPGGLTRELQIGLGMGALIFNLIVYGCWIRARWLGSRRSRSRCPDVTV